MPVKREHEAHMHVCWKLRSCKVTYSWSIPKLSRSEVVTAVPVLAVGRRSAPGVVCLEIADERVLGG